MYASRVAAFQIIRLISCISCEAQFVDLRLREDSSAKPVIGAIVRLIRQDTIVSQALTNEVGRVKLLAIPGTYRIRVDRIGFIGFMTQPFSVEADRPFLINLAVASQPLKLPEVTVSGKSSCGKVSEDAELTAALWDEVRKALTANRLTQQSEAIPLLVRDFERELSRSGRPVREWVYRSEITYGSPFGSLPPSELGRKGFIYQVGDSTVFAAPDAQLLLSDEFVSTHCFRTVSRADSASGLRFEPTAKRAVPDVLGTLWVDRASHELRELEFQYTGFMNDLIREPLGGKVEFLKLPSGNWVISYWHIRMPITEQYEITRARRVVQGNSRLLGFVELGGRTVVAKDTSSVIDRAFVVGEVMDSSTHAGLAGAVVTVVGGRDSATTGDSGAFLLAVPVSGPRTVKVRHPKLAATGERFERDVVLSLGDTTRVDFAVHSLGALVRPQCGTTGKRAGLVGAVWTIEGRPHPYAELIATWRTPVGTLRTERAQSDERGIYAFCDLAPDQPVTIHLRSRGADLGETTITLTWAEFRWVDIRPTTRR